MRQILSLIAVGLLIVIAKAAVKVTLGKNANSHTIATTQTLWAANPITLQNDKVQLFLPNGWEVDSTHNQITNQFKTQLLSIRHPTQNLFLTVATYAKDQQGFMNLEQVIQQSLTLAQTMTTVQIVPTDVQTVNQYPARQSEITGNFNNIPTTFLVTAIDAPLAYYVIFIHAPTDRFNSAKAELSNLVEGFQEFDLKKSHLIP
jgi:hypothetical protein